MKLYSGHFSTIVNGIGMDLAKAPAIDVGEWQGQRDGRPQTKTVELEDVSLEVRIDDDPSLWQSVVGPNMPWAEDHFQERVSGIPYNPPPSHEYWPFASKANEEHTVGGRFSHTYPERFWPKRAGLESFPEGIPPEQVIRIGIRYFYADLMDVVELLRSRGNTRQAYLPVWFPEDGTASIQGERVPCTLGYHFMIRAGKLTCRYYIRSCDFNRHFRDDVYMAGRLTQWIAERLPGVMPGRLVMHISSLHIFKGEEEALHRKAQADVSSNLLNAL